VIIIDFALGIASELKMQESSFLQKFMTSANMDKNYPKSFLPKLWFFIVTFEPETLESQS